jgi:signal transduction histidine kinase
VETQPPARPARRRRRVKVVKPPPPAPTTVQVTVAPLQWRPTAVDGEPALAAVRRVDTPDGNMTQGFVVLASSATEWLGERASARGAHIVTRAPGGTAVSAPLGVPGWYVAIDAGAAIAAVDADADGLVRAFLGRFVPIALLAMLCGAMVVLVVARAEKLARERARFAAAAAHELRTPLAGLQLYGDMLADGLGDPGKARDYARRMAEEASRLGRVVSNVLGFSQLERGNLSVHATAGDVAAAVRAACERARPTLERAGVAFEVTVPDDAVTARFDGDALARVIGNLLDNAEKYGRDAADRRIALTLSRATTGDGERVEIAVVDHGPGVAASALGRLFRPFVRGIGSDGPPGLGLGLALSRSMAHAMAGDLVHRATPGGGATFVLTLASAG